MFSLEKYIESFSTVFPFSSNLLPWEILKNFPEFLTNYILSLDRDYIINEGIAIHKTAKIESNVILKSPIVICRNSFVAAHAYLRGGVFLAESTSIGPGCEIKTSILCPGSALAHFNFVGDSIIGNKVNFEAGSITANHFNERSNKRIYSKIDNKIIDTGTEKFGALIGDNTKIGANAVLSPGTILEMNSIVKRLELVNQLEN